MIIGFGVHLAIKMLLILAVTHTARISSQLVLWHQGRFLPKARKQVNREEGTLQQSFDSRLQLYCSCISILDTPSRESQCNVCLTTNHNGTLRMQEVTEVSAKLCK